MLQIKVRLDGQAILPRQMTGGASGFDLYARESVLLHPHMVYSVGTGVFVEIPDGYEGQVRSRSGLAAAGVQVYNSPGTIDSDYRGEIRVLLVANTEYKIMSGDRIAQLVFCQVQPVHWIQVECLNETDRAGGFGSTGL